MLACTYQIYPDVKKKRTEGAKLDYENKPVGKHSCASLVLEASRKLKSIIGVCG